MSFMEIFNIGPLEFLFILALALIILGPGEIIELTRKTAVTVRRIIKSQQWQEFWSTTQEIRDLPRNVMRETGLEESVKDLNRVSRDMSRVAAPYITSKGGKPVQSPHGSVAMQGNPYNRRAHQPTTDDPHAEPDGEAANIPDATPGDETPGPMIATDPPDEADFDEAVPREDEGVLPSHPYEVDPPDEDHTILPPAHRPIHVPQYGSTPSEAGPAETTDEDEQEQGRESKPPGQRRA